MHTCVCWCNGLNGVTEHLEDKVVLFVQMRVVCVNACLCLHITISTSANVIGMSKSSATLDGLTNPVYVLYGNMC